MGGSSRQDSIRSGYVSDHEALAGPAAGGTGRGGGGHRGSLGGGGGQPLPVTVIQASQTGHGSGGGIDARMCYLTSSEVSTVRDFLLISNYRLWQSYRNIGDTIDDITNRLFFNKESRYTCSVYEVHIHTVLDMYTRMFKIINLHWLAKCPLSLTD